MGAPMNTAVNIIDHASAEERKRQAAFAREQEQNRRSRISRQKTTARRQRWYRRFSPEEIHRRYYPRIIKDLRRQKAPATHLVLATLLTDGEYKATKTLLESLRNHHVEISTETVEDALSALFQSKAGEVLETCAKGFRITDAARKSNALKALITLAETPLPSPKGDPMKPMKPIGPRERTTAGYRILQILKASREAGGLTTAAIREGFKARFKKAPSPSTVYRILIRFRGAEGGLFTEEGPGIALTDRGHGYTPDQLYAHLFRKIPLPAPAKPDAAQTSPRPETAEAPPLPGIVSELARVLSEIRITVDVNLYIGKGA